MKAKPKTIDEYLAGVSVEKRAALEKLRKTIRASAPKAEECISYQIPSFRLGGKFLVAFGAAANHCAFYSGAFPVEAHKDELKAYSTSKGAIRFSADKPLPVSLVRKLVRARIAENDGRNTGALKLKTTARATRPGFDKSSKNFRTSVTATLSVRNWPQAIDFYKAAFGASELYRVPGGGVGQLSVSGADFWVAEESPQHLNFSPESLGGCSVRMLLVVEDPVAVCAQAVQSGATEVAPVADAHCWRLGRIVDPFGHHWEIGRPLS